MKRQKNKNRQAQGRPMRSGHDVVHLRISDAFGSIADFCEKIKSARPDEKAEDIYMDIFCRGILDYESEQQRNDGGKMKNEHTKNRRGFDPDRLGIWEGCNGEFFPGAMPCRICGKPRAHHLLADVPTAKPQRDHQTALEPPATLKGSLLTPHEACRVVITRGYGPAGPLDHDNLVGGLKQLRDQITEKVLRRSSDAEKDGIKWEYRQEPGRGVKIEIYKDQKTTWE